MLDFVLERVIVVSEHYEENLLQKIKSSSADRCVTLCVSLRSMSVIRDETDIVLCLDNLYYIL